MLGWKREVQYVTLSIEGRPIAQESAYRRYVLSILLDKPFQEEGVVEGQCHLCGNVELVTANLKPLRIKVYINDKVSFAGALREDGFFERYSICRTCYTYLLIADRLLEQELEVQLLQSPVFLIRSLYVSRPRIWIVFGRFSRVFGRKRLNLAVSHDSSRRPAISSGLHKNVLPLTLH